MITKIKILFRVASGRLVERSSDLSARARREKKDRGSKTGSKGGSFMSLKMNRARESTHPCRVVQHALCRNNNDDDTKN